MAKKHTTLTPKLIEEYIVYLHEQERSQATINKYTHDLVNLMHELSGMPLTKTALIKWKQQCISTHAPASVNSKIAAVNGFVTFIGLWQLRLKPLKIQKALFLSENKELTKLEYFRLVRTAEKNGNERLALVLQTICATGIRVSELKFITAEAVYSGRAEISNKGKRRVIFVPDKLRRLLKNYLQKQKITAGAVFVSRYGKPLNRSNIWRDMKALCKRANVQPGKVFPHNLRHLFARTYYTLEKDLSRLADILGHTSVNTTRIYTAESGAIHAQQMGRLGLIVT